MKTNSNILLLPVSSKPIIECAWFAGFIDGDGNFLVRVDKRRAKSVTCRFFIAQRMVDQQTGMSYHDVCFQIAQFLHVRLNTNFVTAVQKSYYVVSMSSKKSKAVLKDYLSRYPLLGSKLFDFKDWCDVDLMSKQNNGAVLIEKVYQHKQEMNRSRTFFSWDHLNAF